VCRGDYDNDGDEDIFITNYGAHRLLRNNGDGTFADVTDQAGLAKASFGPTCCGAGCAFLDCDRDGQVDLFVGNYLEFDAAKAQPCLQANVPVYCSPRTYPMVANRSITTTATARSGMSASRRGSAGTRGMRWVWSARISDGDGWTDIYVGNDVMENFLFHNRRNGTFEEIGLVSGVAVDQYGEPQGSMGSQCR